MLKNIINNKFIALLCIAYFVFAQLSPIDGNHISKLWALLPLLLVLGVKKFPIKMFLYLSIIPLILTASLLFRETINIEGWTFVNIHLGCALFAFLAINNESVRNYFSHEKLCFLIIFFGASLIIITVVEFLIGIPPGRVIFGSQNLTSLTLTLTIPIAFLQIKNNKIKYLYIICAIISVAILIKSRGLSIVILLVTLFYLWNNFRNLSRNYKIAILLIISVLFTIIVIWFNQRYDDFIFGNTIHFRFYAWLRFIETVIFINPIFGYGPSNIVINFNQYQYLYPQIELVSSLDTFYNTHSDWIFFFASGGIVFLVIYLYLHFLLIFKYLTQPNLVRENKFLQISFVAFLVIILTAQYDINNTTYSTLLSFYLIKAFLFQNLVSDKYIVINQNLLKVVLILLLLMPLIAQKKSVDLTQKYSNFVQSQLSSSKYTNEDFVKIAPHFKISDTLITYHYLNTIGDKFNDDTFSELIHNSRKYNKYFEPSLHMSSQYFSFKKDRAQLFELYSDLLYKILIDKKVINISLDPKRIQVVMGENLSYEKNLNFHKITLTSALFQELVRSGASFGNYKIDSYSNFNFKIVTDDSKELIYKNVVNDFLTKLADFSSPLEM